MMRRGAAMTQLMVLLTVVVPISSTREVNRRVKRVGQREWEARAPSTLHVPCACQNLWADVAALRRLPPIRAPQSRRLAPCRLLQQDLQLLTLRRRGLAMRRRADQGDRHGRLSP